MPKKLEIQPRPPQLFSSSEMSRFPSVQYAKELLAQKFGDGLTFEEDMTEKHSGYGFVIALRNGQVVGQATMGLHPHSNASPFIGQNSGRYSWFLSN